MSKTSKVILVTIIATCILLGLGYAAITNITLNIAGTASATADSGNFKVRFTDNIVVSDSAYVTATRTGDTAATINVSGLTTAGDKVTATYEIANDSTDLSSDLNVKATNSNANYFSVSSRLADKSLTAGSKTTVLVTVELLKTPIDADVSTNIGVTLNAIPVQPGEEGSSGLTNDFSKVPIDADLNEYGFFYNEAYTGLTEDGNVTTLITMIPYEDGHVEIYCDDNLFIYLTNTQVVYSNNKITMTMYEDEEPIETIVTENGYQLILDDTTLLDLNDNFADNLQEYDGELNEYGFYYDVPYVAAYGENTMGMIFLEDSTAKYYNNGVCINEYTVRYEENKIYFYEDMYFPVYENGNVITQNGFLGLKVKPNYQIAPFVYISENEENGELEYLDRFPNTGKVGDIYLADEYIYTYTSDEWAVELLTDENSNIPDGYEYSSKTLEAYSRVLNDINGDVIRNMSQTFKDCINLKVCPELPYNIRNMNGTFEGCTSLKTVPYEIPYSVTDMTNTFKGCTSLEGEIMINSNNITEYAGCFEGVDMSKITLTGSASDEIKDLLGKTGNNYTPLIQE